MTTTSLPVIIGVFRDRRLAEQACDILKQTQWIATDPQIIERNTRGIFGAFKSRETTEEAISNELAQTDLSEEQQQLYQHELGRGACLVLAHPQSHLLEIRDILNHHGAYHVFIPFQVGGEQTLSLHQEVPQVQKRIVEIGEIRVHKRVITEERTFTIPVTREEVTIERLSPSSDSLEHPNHTSSDSRDPSLQRATSVSSDEETLAEEGTLRILVREEQVIIQKQAVVVEEIRIHKRIIQDTKHLVEPIKHEEVQIEQIGKALIHDHVKQGDTQ